MIGRSAIKTAMQVDVAVSSEMAAALQLWSAIYANQSPWLNKDVSSLNLGASVASEIARAVTIELKAEWSGSARATFLEAQFAPVLARLRAAVEIGCAKGSLIFKPYPRGGQIAVDLVQADQFYPVAFDASGHITAVVFADQRQVGNEYYTRLEYHHTEGSACTIRNLAFKSGTKNMLGSEVPLNSVPEWADLLPEATIQDIDRPLYAYFRFPQANNIDPSSPLGVSCYSRAVDLIMHADQIYSTLVWEFESGKRAIYVDELAFGLDADGKAKLPDRRLYRAISTTGSTIGENSSKLFEDWSPEFREAAIQSGLDGVLRKVEFACGLAYGTISDPNFQAKTATEIKTSQQRSYATVTDTQKALESALRDLAYAMDVWTTLYGLATAGAYEIVFDFDDSVIVDKDLQFQQDLRLVQSGLMSKVDFLMRNFRMSEAVAKQKVAEIQAEQPADPFFGEEGA